MGTTVFTGFFLLWIHKVKFNSQYLRKLSFSISQTTLLQLSIMACSLLRGGFTLARVVVEKGPITV